MFKGPQFGLRSIHETDVKVQCTCFDADVPHYLVS